jgi:hypothetical protein
MGINIDLKPLSEETIKQMGYSFHDLWLVKIDSIIFGPFETESLKHYVHDNEVLFEQAEASLLDEKEWKPFWEHTKFQTKKMQLVSENFDGPFWIMDFGLKLGPFTYYEIDKKIEMGLLVMTDYISVDSGENWVKIYQVEGLDRRIFSPEVLPKAPYESNLKTPIMIENKQEKTAIEEFANLAFLGHQQEIESQLKMDEMTLKAEIHSHRQSAVRWLIPLGAAIAMSVITTLYSMFTAIKLPDLSTENKKEKSHELPRSLASEPRPVLRNQGHMPSPDLRPVEESYYQNHSAPSEHATGSRYQTRVETHEDLTKDVDPYPVEESLTETELSGGQQSSLVDNSYSDEQSLDSALNSQPSTGKAKSRSPAEGPAVEEASDF